MKQNFLNGFRFLLFCLLISILSFSCINQKTITYFNNLPDSSHINLDTLLPPQLTIQINDVLELKIGGENEKTVQYFSEYFGAAGSSGSAGASSAGAGGMQFTVNSNGEINLPKAGKIKVVGLTWENAADTIQKAYSEYLLNPIVILNGAPIKFSILGEIRSPGMYTSTSGRINLFEALAMAGDMTQFAKRNDVKIIRQNACGKREIISIDFNDKGVLNSSNYYINRNDIIYVQSNKLKIFGDNTNRTTTIIGAFSTIIALFLLISKI